MISVPAGAAVNHSVTKSTATSGQKKWPACLSSLLTSADTDLGGYERFLGLFSPCLISLVIFFVTYHSWRRRRLLLWLSLLVNHWVICRGPLGNPPWTTGWRGGPALLQFSGLWLMLPWTVFSRTMVLICWLMKKTNIFVMILVALEIWFFFGNVSPQCLEHRVKRGGKNGAYETAIFPLFFRIYFRLFFVWQTWVWRVNGLGFC